MDDDSTEFCGGAAVLSPQLDGRIHGEHCAVRVHRGGGHRIWGMGERHQLRQAGQNLRSVCEMLSVPDEEILVNSVLCTRREHVVWFVIDFTKLGILRSRFL